MGEPAERCKAGLKEVKVPVQRLVLILPRSEQGLVGTQEEVEAPGAEASGEPQDPPRGQMETPVAQPLPPRPASARQRRRGLVTGPGLVVQALEPEEVIKDL